MAGMKDFLPTQETLLSAAKPFVKWVGGKTQLLPELHASLANEISAAKNFIYVEPFCGGASLFFSLFRELGFAGTVILNDINAQLMETFRTVRDSPRELVDSLREIECEYLTLSTEARTKFFYERRDEFNADGKELSRIRSATLFIFLNKTCFNGLFRVNAKGKFNTPCGRYRNPKICDEQTILADSAVLQNAQLLCGDFAETLAAAEKLRSRGNEKFLFYIDPPYKPTTETANFTSYSANRFNDRDQQRLFRFCRELDAHGIRWLQSNSDAFTNDDPPKSYFEMLYTGAHIRRVPAKRAINAIASRRGNVSEVLISNF